MTTVLKRQKKSLRDLTVTLKSLEEVDTQLDNLYQAQEQTRQLLSKVIDDDAMLAAELIARLHTLDEHIELEHQTFTQLAKQILKEG